MAKKSKADFFDVSAAIADTLDEVAKRQGFESSSLDVAPPISSGMLALDMILGGGLRPGMLTAAGEEQCAKSTVALTAMGAAINSKIPLIAFLDYEGCVTADTLLSVNGGTEKPLSELFDLSDYPKWEPGTWVNQFRDDVDTLGVGHLEQRKAQLYYRGEKPITRVTLDNGATLDGYAHPFFVLLEDGSVIEKRGEDLVPGDTVLFKEGANRSHTP